MILHVTNDDGDTGGEKKKQEENKTKTFSASVCSPSLAIKEARENLLQFDEFVLSFLFR